MCTEYSRSVFVRPLHQLTFAVVHRHKGKLYSKPVSFLSLAGNSFLFSKPCSSLATAKLCLCLFNYRSMEVCVCVGGGNGSVAPCVLKLVSGQIHTTARFASREVAS